MFYNYIVLTRDTLFNRKENVVPILKENICSKKVLTKQNVCSILILVKVGMRPLSSALPAAFDRRFLHLKDNLIYAFSVRRR